MNPPLSTALPPLSLAGSQEAPLYGLGVRFDSPEKILRAATALREKGYTHFESYTPYPIHGLTEAMRLPKSILSFLVLLAGISTVVGVLLLEMVPGCFFYPLTVDARPSNFSALPQYIPIIVALTLMIGAATAVNGMFVLGGMPRLNHPMFAWDLFSKEASRGFFLVVEASDKKFSLPVLSELLHDLGGSNLTAIHEEPLEESSRLKQ